MATESTESTESTERKQFYIIILDFRTHRLFENSCLIEACFLFPCSSVDSVAIF
jgi:hypothetical protein